MVKVIVIRLTDRIKETVLVQEILTKHAGIITTRLGFHELSSEICSREACIILHLNVQDADADILKRDLSTVGGIEIGEMDFDNAENESQITSDAKLVILGIMVERDLDSVVTIQKILTRYGCTIRTRLGVNEKFFGKDAGLIILELNGDISQMELLIIDLRKQTKTLVRKLIF